ncbi:exo-beta-N-acetylmuramidase NamZ domain-containing protein [Microbulbifer sp. SA54]|uniref:exo-beta-N-acetylmuramidase NamZ family protein n=1 Tax=Microbulbifer sp. SA54 TaxID=3401577 RepID=UPI003AAD4E2F
MKKATVKWVCSLALLGWASMTAGGESSRTGAEQPEAYLPLLAKQQIGLVVNQTSRVGDRHLIDVLRARDVAIARIFALEHGVRGSVENGGKVADGIDGPSGLPIVSLYGSQYKPTEESLRGLDWLVFDIQDVGVRFYTYISSLHYLMQACADFDVPLLVLDRPNPNGDYVDGPVLEPAFRSFVGMHPIPLVHGMTVGELARMINGEGWLDNAARCDLTVIPVSGYRRSQSYSLPVRPSPNLPNDLAIRLYPSLGLFEGTTVSVGRGTASPFQILGHPADTRGEYVFTPLPVPGASENPKHNGVLLRGDDLRGATPGRRLDLAPLLDWFGRSGERGDDFFSRAAFFDKLAGTDQLRRAVLAGDSEAQIRATWQPALAAFREQRKPYLLYPDISPADQE